MRNASRKTKIQNPFYTIYNKHYRSTNPKVSGLNGSGRSPAALDVARARADGILGDALPTFHIHTVTVPGAAAAWCDTVEQFGRLKLAGNLPYMTSYYFPNDHKGGMGLHLSRRYPHFLQNR